MVILTVSAGQVLSPCRRKIFGKTLRAGKSKRIPWRYDISADVQAEQSNTYIMILAHRAG